MHRGYDHKQFSILYVDDEPQALKYFTKAYTNDFNILTASGAEAAMKLLEEKGDEIGVLLTDQRMPGQTGVDLLNKVRKQWPGVVRIITTAYSDLEDAIESVNSGGVHQYVTKPWDVRDLKGILMRAMEFFLVQRERDVLLREKLSVLQRMIILDRVRSFTVLAASLACRVRNSMAALKAFFDFVPVSAGDRLDDAEVDWGDLWTLAQQESQRLLNAVDSVLHATVESDYRFNGPVSVEEVLGQELDTISADLKELGITVEQEVAPGLSPVKADPNMIKRLLGVLVQRVGALAGEGKPVKIEIKPEPSVYGTPGIRLRFAYEGSAWNAQQISTLFSAVQSSGKDARQVSLDVLAAFFMAHHHGGQLLVHPSPPKGPGFELLLPLDPEATKQPALESDWLDRIFTNLEAWGELEE